MNDSYYSVYSDYNYTYFYDIDTRFFPYPGEIKSIPHIEAALKILSYTCIILISLFGNVMVILTILRHRRMHTTINMYILNLGIADLLVTLMCMWVHLVDDVTEGWVLGAFFCTTNSFFQVLSLIASTLTLSMIACDRFFGIVFAIKARVTKKRYKVFIGCMWIFAACVSIPLLIHRRQFTREWEDHIEIWCQDNWPIPSALIYGETTLSQPSWYPSRKLYYTIVAIALYFFPCAIMTLAYAFVFYTLWSKELPGECLTTVVIAQHRKMKKVVAMLCAVLLVFVLSWLPFVVSLLYVEFRTEQHQQLPDWYPKFQYAAIFLSDANSAFNPIIYTGFNKRFRKEFLTMLRLCKRHRKTPFWADDSQTARGRQYYSMGTSRIVRHGTQYYSMGTSRVLGNDLPSQSARITYL